MQSFNSQIVVKEIFSSTFTIHFSTYFIFSIVQLADDHDGQMYGAPHKMALMVARSTGIFLDFGSNLAEWSGRGICKKHMDELSRDYFIEPLSTKSISGKRCSACLYPEAHAAKGSRVMSFIMSKNLLQSKNFLVPVGARKKKYFKQKNIN